MGHVGLCKAGDFIKYKTSIYLDNFSRSEVLCFYLHPFCSTDIAVGLMFERQQNESPYGKSVTVTETVFTKRTLAGELLVKHCYSERHKKLTEG